MTARLVALREPIQRSAVVWFGAAVALSLAAGMAVSRGDGLQALAATAAIGACVAGIANWRRHAYGLLIFLPFSGIPIVALYPHTSIGVLAGDVLFVLPVYAGFLTEFLTGRKRIAISGLPTKLLGLLALLVIGQALNPSLPNILVGLIGVKTWLFYIPLVFVGYHLISTERDLNRVLSIAVAAAIAPIVIGILQALLISSGHANVAYRPYGSAAAAVSQNFSHFQYGSAALGRVPSTFSFVTQYYLFTISMIAVTYALWRSAPAGRSRSWAGRVVWLLVLAASFLSGARGAFLMAPLLVIMIVLLERGSLVPAVMRVVAPALVLIAAGAAIGAAALQLIRHAFSLALGEGNSLLITGFRDAIHLTWLGLGSGIDTSGARYALSGQGVGLVSGPFESWYVKTLLELGIPGLCIVGLLLATLVVGGLRRHRLVRDPRLRSVSAALLAVLFWVLINDFKGKYIDLDPLNVYFWLFAGVLMRVWALDAGRRPVSESETS